MATPLLGLFATLLVLLPPVVEVAAQATELGRQSLGRPYWHVFLAYAVVVLLIGGWVVSIARRLRRIEGRLPETDA